MTRANLAAVGLRDNPAKPFMLRVRYRADDGRVLGGETFAISVPDRFGRRTLGEYWRRERLIRWVQVNEWVPGDQWTPRDRDNAIAYCRACGWKASVIKPGLTDGAHRYKGRGR